MAVLQTGIAATGSGGIPVAKTSISVTPAMLAAGRKAFLRHRRTLNDLHDFFDCDLEIFLRGIYREMARAG